MGGGLDGGAPSPSVLLFRLTIPQRDLRLFGKLLAVLRVWMHFGFLHGAWISVLNEIVP